MSERGDQYLEAGTTGTNHSVGLTVLVPTYNRCDVLRETLARIAASDLSGLDLEIVVIDNNGDDHTPECVTEFKGRLPLRYLRENRVGKNCALNKALRESRLREVVVFIDDDITPKADWLKEIAASVQRWPDVLVFGGKVQVGWPGGKEPEWVASPWVKIFGFAWHDMGDQEQTYAGENTPMGPCFWVRKSIFERITSFDEKIGPMPRNRVMGSEVSFFLEVERKGLKMVYCPRVQVLHRIEERQCSIASLRRRAYRCGRGEARLYGIHRNRFLRYGRWLWSMVMVMDLLAYSGGRFAVGLLTPRRRWRAELSLRAMVRMGKIIESFRLAWRKST